MPKTKITISLSAKKIKEVDQLVHTGGFRSRDTWATFAMDRLLDLWFEESPNMKPKTVISRMRKTDKYSDAFLEELGTALEYADRSTQ